MPTTPIKKIKIQAPDSTTPVEIPIGAYAENVLYDESVGAKNVKQALDDKASNTAFTGATASTAGTAGIVPAPAAGDQDKFLKADGTWATASSGNVINNVADGTGERAVVEGAVTSGTYQDEDYAANVAFGDFSHAEGMQTLAFSEMSHAEGYITVAKGAASHAEGGQTIADKIYSHAEGHQTTASGARSHAEGGETVASGGWSHAEGTATTASGSSSHAEGNQTIANGDYSHAEGYMTTTSNDGSHAEGFYTIASGENSHAEGDGTIASSESSHAEGQYTTANGDNGAHAEGSRTIASSGSAHAEGSNTVASGYNSHAEGLNTVASGDSTHAEGSGTTAQGDKSHAEGYYTTASGEKSHAEGSLTIAGYDNQHVQGTYNDNKATTLFEIGNGTSSQRKNIFEVYNDGSLSTDNGVTKVKLENLLPTSQKGAANGVAELDSNGKVPSSQLPSYVDDVIEVANYASLPTTGEAGKIYITLDDNKTYRWSGTAYVEISASLALGETESTAYRGDRGKTAYDHATESGKISSAVAEGLYKIAATAGGHIASTTAVTKSDITALGIPGEAKEYEATTTSVGSASAWNAGSVTNIAVNGDTLDITIGVAPSLTITSTTVATGIQEKT